MAHHSDPCISAVTGNSLRPTMADTDILEARIGKRAKLLQTDVIHLLASCKDACASSLAGTAPSWDIDREDILHVCAAIKTHVHEKLGQYGKEIELLAMGAIGTYRTRQTDISLRDQVYIMHLVEGETHLRSHNGSVFLYRDGSWQLYNGVVPEAMLMRLKAFMLRLEGLFLFIAEKWEGCLDTQEKVTSAIQVCVDSIEGSPEAVSYTHLTLPTICSV